MGKPLRRGVRGVLAALACGVLSAGCTDGSGATAGPDPTHRPTTAGRGPESGAPGPTATATAAPPEAAALAERYRAAGGDPDVYGIQRGSGPGGVPLLVIRTRNGDPADGVFRKQNASIASYLTAEEGSP